MPPVLLSPAFTRRLKNLAGPHAFCSRRAKADGVRAGASAVRRSASNSLWTPRVKGDRSMRALKSERGESRMTLWRSCRVLFVVALSVVAPFIAPRMIDISEGTTSRYHMLETYWLQRSTK